MQWKQMSRRAVLLLMQILVLLVLFTVAKTCSTNNTANISTISIINWCKGFQDVVAHCKPETLCKPTGY